MCVPVARAVRGSSRLRGHSQRGAVRRRCHKPAWQLVARQRRFGGRGTTAISADNNWGTPDAPLAAPGDYFDFTFTAPANTPYHVWLRLRAAGNSKLNDSVFVQFSDALDGNGAAVDRLSAQSGLAINLQSCNGCALAGWGWMDGAYWLSPAAVVSFAGGGSHTLRIQTREDGVQLDQVVIGTGAYLIAPPGQNMNDHTIVPKSGTTGASTPFNVAPAQIPGVVLASDFDNGGEGVAYHDTSVGNSGGAYRQTDVDLEPSTDGGYDVGWISAGEWLDYTVNVAVAGTYSLTFRIASSGTGGTFHLEMNGTNVTGPIAVPDTGGWQAWQSVGTTVSLNAGTQVARLIMDTAGTWGAVGNITSMQFASAVPQGSTPFSGTPVSLPGTVEAENFDKGGEGTAYHDSTPGNSGGAYRQTDVDLEPATSGGYDVGWTSAGEWLAYSVNVTAGGRYTVTFRVASLNAGGAFHLEMNGTNATGALSVPDTGGWQSWQTISANVTLTAGPQIARLVLDTDGTLAVGNFDSIVFVAGSTGPPSEGGTITVPAGGDLQMAIDSAQSGDTILLAPGAVYSGTFVLPVKSGDRYITIRSAAPDSALPTEGTRIAPASASLLPKIQGGVAGMPAFTTAPGAHHYRLMFLEIVNTYNANDIMEIGDGSSNQNTFDAVPHDFVIDRRYIHGDATTGQKRGIALNSATTTVINSYISDIKSSTEDAQAIGIWNGPGPFTIINNYLEASGENFMVGGADPSIPNLVPSDITFSQNHVSKQPSWRGQPWIVKNLLEFKNAQRVVVDNNLIEYCWAAAQVGYAFMITPVNQEGTAPWTVVQQIQFTNNVVRHVASAFDILGLDPSTSIVTNGIVVRNNLFLDISKANWGGTGQLYTALGGTNIVFDHNTVFTDGTSVIYADIPVTGLVFTNNIIPDNAWAVMGSGTSPGSGTLVTYFPGASFAGNVLIGASAGLYPPGNYFPSTVAGVGFTNASGPDYRLLPSSPYGNAAVGGGSIGYSGPPVQP
jgi:hypothetical protein